VKYIVDLGHKVITTSCPSSFDWVSRHGAKAITDHTKFSAEVLGELRVNGPFVGGVFDAIGTLPVTALLTSLLADFEAEGSTLLYFLSSQRSATPAEYLRGYFRAVTMHSSRKIRNRGIGGGTRGVE